MNDRTLDQVHRQLWAMGGQSFEFGIKNQVDGRLLPRIWQPEQMPAVLPFLKAKNASHHHIYVRVQPIPGRAAGLVLLDDLAESSVSALFKQGLEPCVVVETSPGNFQAWVRVHQESMSCVQATQIARMLATRFGADPCSADWRHYGRLAGFSNRKPQYQTSRGYPFVLLKRARRIIASQASFWLGQVSDETAPSKTVLPPLIHQGQGQIPSYASLAANIPISGPPDQSRIDFAIARYMTRQGYGPEIIGQVLQQSPNLHHRHPGVAQYIERTLAAAHRWGSQAAGAGK